MWMCVTLWKLMVRREAWRHTSQRSAQNTGWAGSSVVNCWKLHELCACPHLTIRTSCRNPISTVKLQTLKGCKSAHGCRGVLACKHRTHLKHEHVREAKRIEIRHSQCFCMKATQPSYIYGGVKLQDYLRKNAGCCEYADVKTTISQVSQLNIAIRGRSKMHWMGQSQSSTTRRVRLNSCCQCFHEQCFSSRACWTSSFGLPTLSVTWVRTAARAVVALATTCRQISGVKAEMLRACERCPAGTYAGSRRCGRTK